MWRGTLGCGRSALAEGPRGGGAPGGGGARARGGGGAGGRGGSGLSGGGGPRRAARLQRPPPMPSRLRTLPERHGGRVVLGLLVAVMLIGLAFGVRAALPPPADPGNDAAA